MRIAISVLLLRLGFAEATSHQGTSPDYKTVTDPLRLIQALEEVVGLELVTSVWRYNTSLFRVPIKCIDTMLDFVCNNSIGVMLFHSGSIRATLRGVCCTRSWRCTFHPAVQMRKLLC
jgi:hypothetical protein